MQFYPYKSLTIDCLGSCEKSSFSRFIQLEKNLARHGDQFVQDWNEVFLQKVESGEYIAVDKLSEQSSEFRDSVKTFIALNYCLKEGKAAPRAVFDSTLG